jgi:hypothetical protein
MRLASSVLIAVSAALGFVLWKANGNEDFDFLPSGAVLRHDLIEPHRAFLRTNYPKALEQFEALLKYQPESAIAEAAVFSLLNQAQLNPEPAENPKTGGADFICKPRGRDKFAVEVTTMHSTSVETKTGIPQDSEEGDGGAYSMITFEQARKVQDKCDQMEKQDYKMPVVVVLCTLHEHAQGAFRSLAVEFLQTSVPRIVTSFNLKEPARQETGLEDSIFIETKSGKLIPRCKNISAVLLLHIGESISSAIGILHFQPNFPFDIKNLPSVPFNRIVWPVVGGKIKTEWVAGSTRPVDFWHFPI